MSDFFSSQNIIWFKCLSLAHIFIFFLFTLDLISYSVSYSDVVRPYFILICIYFWSIYRPSLLLPVYVFILGILFDFLLNYPIGLHAILFVVVQWIIRDQRLFFLGQPYVIVWMGFALTCFSVMLSEWMFFTILSDNVFDFYGVLYGTLISTLIFPMITLLFNLIYRILPPISQSHFL